MRGPFLPLLFRCAVTLGAVLLALIQLASEDPANVDDFFVTLVYARHFAETGDFFYNAGEGALDGFTSLLDVLLKGAVLAAGATDGIRVAGWFAVIGLGACVVLGGFLVAGLTRDLGEPRRSLVFASAVIALAFTPGLAEGAAYLLETPLFGVTILAGALFFFLPLPSGALRGALAAALGLSLVLARPEGLALGLLLVAFEFHRVRAGDSGTSNRWFAPGLFFVACAFYFAWRIRTFGYWAPNSYYAKTSEVRSNEVRDGLAYVAAFARTLPGGLALLLIAASLVFERCGSWASAGARRATRAFLLATSVSLAALVLSGGDCYAGARLLAPITLLGLFAVVGTCAGLGGRAAQAFLAGLALLAFLPLVRLRNPGATLRLVFNGPQTAASFECSRSISERLAGALRVVPGGARLAQTHFQRFKYFEDDVSVFDITGLNHRATAHLSATSPVRFGKDGLRQALEEGVELLHLDHRWVNSEDLTRHDLRTLLHDPRLREQFFGYAYGGRIANELAELYRPASLVDACGSGTYFNVLVRRDLAESLAAAGFSVRGRAGGR